MARSLAPGFGRLGRFLPMLAVMAGIFCLSHQPGDSLIIAPLAGFDKLLHGLAYGVLATAFLYGLQPEATGLAGLAVFLPTVLVCLGYGLSDEYHQTFIPGRVFSLGDLAADVAGGAAVALFVIWKTARNRYSSC